MSITNSNDWLHFYQESYPGAGAGELLPSSVSDATAVTTTATPAQLSPEGGVSKPIRRRSRSSRRTPTTLLNTDTTNFRAMVQQFTGAPSAPHHHHLFGPPRPLPVNGPSHQHFYHQQNHYAYPEGGDNAFFQRLSATPTSANNVNDRVRDDEVLVEHGRRFFPTTSS